MQNSGSTSDVGTGPVLILLALAFWPAVRARTRRASQQPAAGPPALPARRHEAQPAAGGDPAR